MDGGAHVTPPQDNSVCSVDFRVQYATIVVALVVVDVVIIVAAQTEQ